MVFCCPRLLCHKSRQRPHHAFKLYEQGVRRVEKELDIVKVLATLRSSQFLLRVLLDANQQRMLRFDRANLLTAEGELQAEEPKGEGKSEADNLEEVVECLLEMSENESVNHMNKKIVQCIVNQQE